MGVILIVFLMYIFFNNNYMKLYESTQNYMEKQSSRSTSYKHPDIKESADFIIDQYGCRLFSEAARTHAI